jgi:HAD superfamily hydrolase (TIGR01509 family)
LDSESANADSAIYAFSDLGILISEEDIKYIIGRHPEDYIKYFLEKYNFSYKDFRVRQSKKYHEIIELVPFFQNIIDLVKEIHSKNILVALTTSSSKENTFEMLEKMRLGGIFDVVVTREDCTYKKPNPEPYIITANKLNVDPQDCLVFEDTNV